MVDMFFGVRESIKMPSKYLKKNATGLLFLRHPSLAGTLLGRFSIQWNLCETEKTVIGRETCLVVVVLGNSD